MSGYDNDILLAMQRDGIRTISGHHIRTPEPEQDDDGWDEYRDVIGPPYEGNPGHDGEGDRDWKLDR